MTKPQRKVDWEAIGLDYCSGDTPVAEIARKHGVAAVSIYAKARRDGWGRAAPDQDKAAAAAGAARTARTANAAVRRMRRASNRRGSKHAMRRMIGLVNRLTDELTQHLDQTAESDTPPTDQKFAADIVTSLTRTLEKLTQLEREANRQSTEGREQAKTAGANDASTGTSTDTWDELQRRLARLAAGKSED